MKLSDILNETSTAADYTTLVQAELDIQRRGIPALLEILKSCGYDDDTIVNHEPTTRIVFKNNIPTLQVGFDYICNETGELRTDGEVSITVVDNKWRADYTPSW